MKKQLIITLLFGSMVVFSVQSQNLEITYDYTAQTFSYNYNTNISAIKPRCIQSGETVQFQIINVNRFHLDIGFNKTINTFNITPPEIPTIGSIPIFGGSVAAAAPKSTKVISLQAAFAMVLADINNINNLLIQLENWRLTQPDIIAINALEARINVLALNANLRSLDDAYYDFILDADPNKLFTKELMRAKKELDAKDLRKIYTDILKITSHIVNGLPFEYESPIVTAAGDELILDINIDPKAGKKTLPISASKLKVKLNVNRTFRYSFSTGLFISKVTDQKFNTQPNLVTDATSGLDTVGSYTLIQETSSDNTLGVAGYFHYTYHPNCNFGIGINMGGGIDLEEKAQYMAGGTIVIGHKQRLLINAGVSWARITELSGGLTVGSATKSPLEIKTSKEMDHGFYLSLSYNLTK